MKQLLFFILLLTNSGFSYAQEYYTIDELKFSTEREKVAFSDFINDSTLFLPLLVEMGGNPDALLIQKVETKMNAIYSNLDKMKITLKKPKKQIQVIYKEVHSSLFTKYIEVIPFYKAFTIGEYNCATATAIYAMVLDHYNIPYQIKEKPNHVYLTAYPKEYDIIMESTSPGSSGVIAINDNMKSNIINKLIADKVVTAQEVKTKGVNAVFNEYFFSDTDINFRKLISWLYSNEAYQDVVEEKLSEALEEYKKAYFIEQNEIFEEIIVNINIEKLAKDKPYTEKYAMILKELSKFFDYNSNLSSSTFTSEHYGFLQEWVINKNDVDTYLKYYEILENIGDSTTQEKIKLDHYEMLGRYYYEKEEFDKAIDYAMQAYEMMPKNMEVNNLINASVIKNCMKNYRVDLNARLSYLESIFEKYPVLTDRTELQVILLEIYFKNAFDALMQKDLKTAKKNIDAFEQIYDPAEHYQVPEQNVVTIYDHLGMIYFKRNQITNARNAFKKGLSYFPNAYNLTTKLNML